MSLLILNMAIIHTVAEIYTGSSMVFFIPRVCFKTLYLRGFAWILLCVSIISGVFYAASPMIRPLIAHLVVLALLSALHNFHTYLVLGRQAIRSYNVLVFFQPISAVLILSIAVFGMQDKSINASLLALYGSYGGSVLLSLFLLRRLPAQEGEQATPSWKALLQLGFTNQLANLAHLLSNRYNYYIIAGISTSLVGVLSSGTSLIESVWTVSAAISPLVLSKVANSEAGQEEARLSLQLAKLSFLLSFVAVIILLFIPVQWFTQILGADFEAVKLVMLLLSPGVLALSFSSVLSHYYSGLGRQRVLLAANSSGLAITLLTSYWLISRYGLAGACVAASLAYAMQCLVLAIVFWRERSHLA